MKVEPQRHFLYNLITFQELRLLLIFYTQQHTEQKTEKLMMAHRTNPRNDTD